MDDGVSPGNIYLIEVRDYVVLTDLIGSVHDFDPGSHILTATGIGEAVAQLRSVDRLAIAFLEAGPRRVAQLKLDVEIRQRGGRLVLLGDDAEDEWEASSSPSHRWPTLLRPFTSQTVLSLIIAADGREEGAPA